MSFVKQIAAAFIGGTLALTLVMGVSFYVGKSYIDGKLEVADATLERVETLVNTSKEKIDVIFNRFSVGVEKVDETVTNSRVFQRLFGDKKE